MLFRSGVGSGYSNYALTLSNGVINFVSENGGSGTTSLTAGSSIDANRWYHIAFTSDGSTSSKLYINGSEVADASSGKILNTGGVTNGKPLLIGAGSRSLSTRGTFGGMIDEVRIWNVQRSEGDIKDNLDRKSTRLNSSHSQQSRMPSSA